MKKNMLSIGLIISGAILLILSYQSGLASAENRYECGSKIMSEIYFNQFNQSTIGELNEALQEGSLYKSENVVSTYSVGEREVVSLTTADLDIRNRWNISLTDKEIDLLAKIVWLESRGEPNTGSQAVVEVVLNRMKHWDFKGSLYEVLSRKDAFATWKLLDTAKPTKREYKNILKVLDGESNILDKNTVYFSTSPRNQDITIHFGNHYFCRYEYSSPQDKEW